MRVGPAALVAIAGWAMGCRTVCVGVAIGEGVVGISQPAFSPLTITSTIRIGMHLPRRCIYQAPCLVLVATKSQSRRQVPQRIGLWLLPGLPSALLRVGDDLRRSIGSAMRLIGVLRIHYTGSWELGQSVDFYDRLLVATIVIFADGH